MLLPPSQVEMTDIAGGRSALYGLLASFYGGVVEEVQLRLFLMTLIAWSATWLVRRQAGFDGTLSPRIAWAAILVAALAFAAGHLPAAAAIWGLDTGVALRTVLLNGLGGVVFGHFGDRVGRKKMLVVALLMMGVATFAIGLLPTYASIGIAAPILLLVCRLVQGFAAGADAADVAEVATVLLLSMSVSFGFGRWWRAR